MTMGMFKKKCALACVFMRLFDRWECQYCGEVDYSD